MVLQKFKRRDAFSFLIKIFRRPLFVKMNLRKIRNTLIHDYDGDVAKRYFKNITEDFFELLQQFRNKAEQWYQVDESDGR